MVVSAKAGYWRLCQRLRAHLRYSGTMYMFEHSIPHPQAVVPHRSKSSAWLGGLASLGIGLQYKYQSNSDSLTLARRITL